MFIFYRPERPAEVPFPALLPSEQWGNFNRWKVFRISHGLSFLLLTNPPETIHRKEARNPMEAGAINTQQNLPHTLNGQHFP